MEKYQLQVKDIIQETNDSISIVFENELTKPIHYKAGQFLTLEIPMGKENLRRAYSLASAPSVDKNLKITVKRVDNGKVSNLLNDTLQIGDYLNVLEPMGVFTPELSPQNNKTYLLWASGSGITPILSILKEILHIEPFSKILLVYANRNENSIIFKEELDFLVKQYPEKLSVLHVLSQPQSDWADFVGRLDEAKVKLILQDFISQKNSISQWMCGVEGIMQTITNTSEALGFEKPYKENFFAAIEESAQEVAQKSGKELRNRHIKVKYDGEIHEITIKPEQSILEAALEADIQLPYSCQSGLCTACMGKCTAGSVLMTEDDCLTDDELKKGFILTCVAYPTSDDVFIEVD
ncbi:MAG: 2Fe-2S iron-sulfur cluster-binding protein [Thermonemataceae bacterium]|nr:2Fe-2S iron-sulfur cluster-binding protein [Thermonemataceae bacterium]